VKKFNLDEESEPDEDLGIEEKSLVNKIIGQKNMNLKIFNHFSKE
jgi:hypothetical protein